MKNFSTHQQNILTAITNSSKEFTPIFYGRGSFYKGYEFLCIDSIDTVLHVAYYEKVPSSELEEKLQLLYAEIDKTKRYEAIVLQRRYLSKAPSQLLYGTLPSKVYAYEDDLRYNIKLLENQNHGFFGDMREGRNFVKNLAKGKKVLNLFSYTCSFSVVATQAEAKSVVNVDMSKGALSAGRDNHHLNKLSTNNVKFMPYNILKSWSRIKRAGPYDLIIIDPPSFQKGSFASTKDYQKIIKRLSELASPRCIVLSALNNPSLDTQFLHGIFKENAKEFHYKRRLENLETYPCKDEERALKNLIFQNFSD